MWSSRSYFEILSILCVNWLTVAHFHVGYPGCKQSSVGACQTNKNTDKTRAAHPTAAFQKIFRAFKVWCPNSIIYVVIETHLAPKLIAMPWIAGRLRRGVKLTHTHYSFQLYSAFLPNFCLFSSESENLNAEHSHKVFTL